MKKITKKAPKKAPKKESVVADFLPDADEIEMRPIPGILQHTLHIMLLALVCFVVWAIFSKLDVNVNASGRLITLQPNIVVQPLETAIIQKIDVSVGQVVK